MSPWPLDPLRPHWLPLTVTGCARGALLRLSGLSGFSQLLLDRAAGDDHRSHQRHQQDHRGDLEGEQVLAQQRVAEAAAPWARPRPR